MIRTIRTAALLVANWLFAIGAGLLTVTACGGGTDPGKSDKPVAAESAGPTCEDAWAHTLTLIMQDPDMSKQWANLPAADRASRGANATTQCQTERWTLAVRRCYVEAKGNADLHDCEALRSGGGPRASPAE